jgi:multicomponent K+:H+ antiporter subunit E
MKRWLPSPLVSGMLLLLWALLNQNLEPTTLLSGAIVAIVAPLLARPFMQPIGFPRPKKPLTLLRLLGMALVEIVRSALEVATQILFVKPDRLKSRFMRIPLDLRNPYGLALLSCLINSTPGTVWVEILPEGEQGRHDGRHELALHVFDLQDEQWWIDIIKKRYERPLIEIFE